MCDLTYPPLPLKLIETHGFVSGVQQAIQVGSQAGGSLAQSHSISNQFVLSVKDGAVVLSCCMNRSARPGWPRLQATTVQDVAEAYRNEPNSGLVTSQPV